MPAERVTVYPTKPNAVGLKHPHDGKLAEGGSEWPLDSFTCRRLTDGSVTREPPKPPATETAKATEAAEAPTSARVEAPVPETPAA